MRIIKAHGGVVRTGVSGVTDYLVVGSVLEDGRAVEEGSKHRTAVSKGVAVVNEAQLVELCLGTYTAPAYL